MLTFKLGTNKQLYEDATLKYEVNHKIFTQNFRGWKYPVKRW
jgi:hypothetical protein